MIEVQLYTGRTDPDVEFEGTLDSGITRVLFAAKVELFTNGMVLHLPRDTTGLFTRQKLYLPVFDDMLQAQHLYNSSLDIWFGDAMITNAEQDKALYVHSIVPSRLGFPVIRRMSSIIWTYNTLRPYPFRNDDENFFLQGMEYPLTVYSRGYDDDYLQTHALG